MSTILNQPLELSNGAVMPNRLAKAPLEECLANFGGGPPNNLHFNLYDAWAKGQWGMIITGNVGIDRRFLGIMFDVVIPDPADVTKRAEYMPAFKKWARICKGIDPNDARHDDPVASRGDRALVVAQLVHTGRQSIRCAGRAPWKPPMAPSAVPIKTSEESSFADKLLFGTPKELTVAEITDIIHRFIEGAVYCYEAGFDGIELHAAHGYLLSSFLSPSVNLRTDQYGGDADRRFRIIKEIIQGIRAKVPPSFVVGIKLNSGDFVRGGLSEEDALLHVKMLDQTKAVDFVEISGGTYEKPVFLDPKFMAESTKLREGLFTAFAQRCHTILPQESKLRLIVTGGFSTRRGMEEAVKKGDADGVGIARPATLEPALPKKLLDNAIPDAQAVQWEPSSPPFFFPRLPLTGAGWSMLWFTAQMQRIARGEQPEPNISMLSFFWHLLF